MDENRENYREPVESPTDVECPACGSNLFIILYETDIPLEGHILIQTYNCHRCLYKKSSVFPSEPGRHVRLSLKVGGKGVLNTLVYRSPNAFVYIPEIGAEISPGERSTGYVTTVEGILRRLLEYIEMMPYDNEDEFLKVKRTIEDAAEGKYQFTIVIDDETGKSSISSDMASREYD